MEVKIVEDQVIPEAITSNKILQVDQKEDQT